MMYLVTECLCGKEIKVPVEKGRVKTTTCENCHSCHDANIYLHSYRVDNYCCHDELVKIGVAENTSQCNPVLCKNKGECTCVKK